MRASATDPSARLRAVGLQGTYLCRPGKSRAWSALDPRGNGVSSSDRYGFRMSGALAVAVCGVVLASLSLGWQAASYVLSGGRVKVKLLVGALGNGAIVTGPAENLSADWLEGLASQGFSEPIVAITVANVGRQPVKVARWGLKSGLGMSLWPPANGIGPSLPHRLEAGDAATWAVDTMTVQAFFQAANQVWGKSQPGSSRGKSLIGKVAAEVKRPQGTDIVGIVELADGRPKLSKTTFAVAPVATAAPPVSR